MAFLFRCALTWETQRKPSGACTAHEIQGILQGQFHCLLVLVVRQSKHVSGVHFPSLYNVVLRVSLLLLQKPQVSKKESGLVRSFAAPSKEDPWLRVSMMTASNFRNLRHCGVCLPENLITFRKIRLRFTALHLAGGIVMRVERIA
jgi:hypothetical protein